LKIRHDVVAVSSVLVTVALLIQTQVMWWAAVSECEANPWDPRPVYYRFADCWAPAGFASLAVLSVGLIVAWTGYIKRVRWTWFVMLLIAWGWAFPILVVQERPWRGMTVLVPTFVEALKENGGSRIAMEGFLSFLLLVVALVLPAKAFIARRHGGPGDSGRAHSAPQTTLSCLAFTLAFLTLTPAMWRAAATAPESSLTGVSLSRFSFQDCFAPAGIASLVVIAIGLIVTWAGYFRGVRWTWLVMFVIVWVWAFPVFILPYLHPWRGVETIAQSFASSISEGGLERNFVLVSLVFLLMVLALALPAKTFILGRGEAQGGPGARM